MFKNEYIFNNKLIKEYVYKFLCKRIFIMGYVLLIASLIMYTLTKNNTFLMLDIIVIFTIIFSPSVMIKKIMETSKKINNGKIEKTYIEFSDNIIMNEGKAHVEFEYTQIEKIVETKNLILLATGTETAIIVWKQGFTKGTQEEFLNFIKNKIK